MNILVLGAGAVGGYFGGRLAEAEIDVSFLVRPRRSEQLADSGLVVKSPFGDMLSPVKTVLAEDVGTPYDVVMLSCKAYDLKSAITTMTPAVGSDTMVLPLLNGLAHMDALDSAFGPERVLGGLCHLAATLTSDGEIHHLNQLQSITFGERSGRKSERCNRLAEVLSRTQIDVRYSETVDQDMWEKFVMLTSLAAATCLMRASVGEIVSTDQGEAFILETIDECAQIAAAAGHAPRGDALSRIRSLLTEAGSAFTASMLRDMEQMGPIEADHTLGDMVQRGRQSNVETPNLRLAYCHLQAYEARRERGQAPS